MCIYALPQFHQVVQAAIKDFDNVVNSDMSFNAKIFKLLNDYIFEIDMKMKSKNE
jgi:hypothetical protein